MRAAVVANSLPSRTSFADLRRELIDDAPLHGLLLNTASVITPMTFEDTVDELNPIWPTLVTWMVARSAHPTTSRFDLLADFIRTADGNVWPTWPEGRGNMSRYAVLLDYYGRLFP